MAINTGNNPFEVEMLMVRYTTAMELLLQQKLSKLRGHVDSTVMVGAKAASPIQQIGVLQFKQPQGRYAPKVNQEPNFTRRWITPVDRDLPVLVDTFDELRTLVDPKGGISEAVTAAGNRFFDDIIIANALGGASTGADPGSFVTENFDGTNALVADTFGASASTGMTYPKLVEAWRIMRFRQVDLDAEAPCVIMGSQQEADLKKQAEVINRDFNDAAVVENGRITRLAGFDVIVSERLNSSVVSAVNVRNCFSFVRSGLHLGIWKDMSIAIHQRVDLTSDPWELYAMVSAGATRTQQFKVIQINCKDALGFDPTSA